MSLILSPMCTCVSRILLIRHTSNIVIQTTIKFDCTNLVVTSKFTLSRVCMLATTFLWDILVHSTLLIRELSEDTSSLSWYYVKYRCLISTLSHIVATSVSNMIVGCVERAVCFSLGGGCGSGGSGVTWRWPPLWCRIGEVTVKVTAGNMDLLDHREWDLQSSRLLSLLLCVCFIIEVDRMITQW